MAVLQQGSFTSDGEAKTLPIRSDVDWIKTINYTVAAASQTTAKLVECYWQRGLATDTGFAYYKSNAANAANLTGVLSSGGFTLVDTSVMSYGALLAVTSLDTGAPSQINLASTTGLADGDVVRVIDITGVTQYGGLDFVVDNLVPNTQFDLSWTPSVVAGTTGYIRKIVNWDPIFYPPNRVILQISQAASAVVTLNVPHLYTVGQKVRFKIPADFGMTELDGQTATITAVSTANNTITVDVDTSGYTAFAFPLTGNAVTHAQVTPIGMSTNSTYANVLDDAMLNTGIIGIKLAGGAASPGGATNDVIYWAAGTSDLVTNE